MRLTRGFRNFRQIALSFFWVLSTSSYQAMASDYKAAPKTFAKNYPDIPKDQQPLWEKGNPLNLVQVANHRRWVYLGAPLTPHELNDNKANFPEFHNVYVQPAAFEYYRKNKKWPEGTMFLKEMQLTDVKGEKFKSQAQKDGSRFAPSGRGYFPGRVNGMDVMVKDSTRFAESKNWGFYNYGHHDEPYKASSEPASIGECAGCHMANADEDMVYVGFYLPILNPLKRAAEWEKIRADALSVQGK